MTLLQQAEALLAVIPFTIEQARQLEALEAQAQGEEAELIGELWEAVYALADDALLDQLEDEALEEEELDAEAGPDEAAP